MLRHRTTGFVCVCLVVAVAGCKQAPQPATAAPQAERADARVRALADAYLEAYFERNPDQVTLYGIPGRRHDALPDHAPDALKAWPAEEDGPAAQGRAN